MKRKLPRKADLSRRIEERRREREERDPVGFLLDQIVDFAESDDPRPEDHATVPSLDKAYWLRKEYLKEKRRKKPGRKPDLNRAVRWADRYEQLRKQFPRDRKKFLIGVIAKEEGLSDRTIRAVINAILRARGIR